MSAIIVGRRKLVTRVGTHTSPVLAVAFSPDGKQIVSGDLQQVAGEDDDLVFA